MSLPDLVRGIETNSGPASGGTKAVRRAAPTHDGPVATFTLAEMYADQGFVPLAIDVLEHVLKRDPRNERARSRLEELGATSGASGRNSR